MDSLGSVQEKAASQTGIDRFKRRASGKLFIHKQIGIIRNRKIHLPYGKSDRSVSRNAECLHRRLGVTVGNHSTSPFLRDLECT